ncbi:hypothetical protein RDI58_014288 [Solanum bulbocastanum]|uniref:NADH:quinone oxidoreductase/Mrp antiporter transmembrane domain-containing protein n=1 Tax=Solanum bulbocastanum TaxID=147425 RepID=A0AAN8SND3_SOLBU
METPECFSLCSYLLSGYTKKDVRSNEATMKYLLMGGASSSILVHGFSWLYGSSGGEIELQEIRPGKQREDVYERDIQQQEEGKGLNRGTPEHLAISDVSISMVTHYFDESFLRTEEDYVNTYSRSHLSDSIVEDTIFSEEFAMIYLIHA